MKRVIRNKTIRKNENFNIVQAAIVTERINTIIKLSMQKAVLHSQNPSRYPLPQKESALENLFYNQLKNLNKDKRTRVINKIKRISPYRIKQTSGYTKINLRKSEEIASQVKGIVAPKTLSVSNSLYKIYEEKSGFHLERPKTEIKYKKLQCRIKRIECLETNDYRKDEIKLAGVAVNSLLEAEEIGKILIGKKNKKGRCNKFFTRKNILYI